ncbi:MAG TPA: cysteine desulfurase [Candidatus Polarisedimenticolia bacterium]|nr:cysteine desulfurase [Candidatus Polarisedimenticolia bacterium]
MSGARGADPLSAAAGAVARPYDVEAVRRDFPILHQTVHGHPLVYLDNAATTHKPEQVLKALDDFYTGDNANIHRGVHELSQRATASYEAAREKIRGFLNAGAAREVLFVRGTTEAINLVAHSFAGPRLNEGDEILLTGMEHHSNIVPWQMVCEAKKAKLRVVPVNDRGELILEEYERLLGPKTRLVSAVHLSNALGTINPVKEMIGMAHRRGVPVMLDGAQAAARIPLDVRDLDCDFYAFSGHKLYGPTGIGVLYGKAEHLEAMPPYMGGGDMISSVTFEKTLYNKIPNKFEAGTPHVAGVIGLAAAVDYLEELSVAAVAAHEDDLLARATRAVAGIPGLRIVGTAQCKAGILSFVMEGIHPHDLGTVLDQQGIAVRAGHHCTQPLMERFGIPATARASFALYNTAGEVDTLVEGLSRVREVFA